MGEELQQVLWKLANHCKNVVSRGYKERQRSLAFKCTATTTAKNKLSKNKR